MAKHNDAPLTFGALLLGGGVAGYAVGHWLLTRDPTAAPPPVSSAAPAPVAAAPPPSRNARPRPRRGAARPRSHRDVEFAVDDARGDQRAFKTFDDAAGFAVGLAAATGKRVHLDVLVMSRAGATWWGGDDAAESYDEDPEASVFDRLVVQASAQGRVS